MRRSAGWLVRSRSDSFITWTRVSVAVDYATFPRHGMPDAYIASLLDADDTAILKAFTAYQLALKISILSRPIRPPSAGL